VDAASESSATAKIDAMSCWCIRETPRATSWRD